MRRLYLLLGFALLAGGATWAAWTHSLSQHGWKTVQRTLGYPGQETGDGFKVVVPRTDLNVLVHGAWLAPAGGLTSWFAFKPLAQGCLLIGEMTLVDGEMKQVENELSLQGLTLTSLYRPWAGETPGVERLRFWGQGNRVALAQKARALLAATGMPLNPSLTPVPSRPVSLVSWAQPVEKALGPGEWQGSLLRFQFTPAGPVTENGVEIPSYMGLVSELYFQPDGRQAQVYGQWVVPADKAPAVTQSLIEEQIPVTSTHTDLVNSNPVLVTVHFWAQGAPGPIAQGLSRVALKTGLTPVSPQAPGPQERDKKP